MNVISRLLALALAGAASVGLAQAAETGQLSETGRQSFIETALRLRDEVIDRVQPAVTVGGGTKGGFNKHPWKGNIVTTVFWVGERPTANNPTPNHKSSWDGRWAQSFGGTDHPDPSMRKGFVPKGFIPRQNPFYVALPYNDTTRGTTKPEARKVIPWFKQAFVRPGQSVLKGRWVAIRHKGRIAYAQWEDCGPFRTDHWQYVFGNQRPSPNLNQGAGLDVSPAVRDYLGLKGKDVCDWKFVEARDVPPGPWAKFGDNNTFVLQKRGANLFVADRNNAYGAKR